MTIEGVLAIPLPIFPPSIQEKIKIDRSCSKINHPLHVLGSRQYTLNLPCKHVNILPYILYEKYVSIQLKVNKIHFAKKNLIPVQ